MSSRIGSPSLGWRVIRRQLISEPSVVASISLAVLLTAFLLAAAPGLLERVSQEDLHATVSDPPSAQRNIRVERETRLGAGPDSDPMRAIRGYGNGFADQAIPPSVSAVISRHYFVVDSPQFAVMPMPGDDPPHPFPTFVRFRYQEQIEDHLSLLEGDLPSPQEPLTALIGEECPEDPTERARLADELELNGPAEGTECHLEVLPHFQAVVSEPTADAMGYDVGDSMILQPDPTDRLFFGLSMQDLDYRFVLSISGIGEFSDPEEEYWYGDPSLHRPTIQENADLRIIFATGLMSPLDYGTMLAHTGNADRRYTWRHFVDPDLVSDADIELLLSELIPFEQRYAGVVALPTEPRVITQLSDLLNDHLAQRDETVSVLSVAVAGLFSLAVAVILLLGVLMTQRQRGSIVLQRNRGASGGQLTLTRLYEALLLAVPAAVVGFMLTRTVLPAADLLMPYRVTVAFATGATIVLVGGSLPLFRRHLGSLQAPDRGLPRSTPRRVVLEALVLILAVGSVLLLRRRGQIEDAGIAPSFDLLLAVAPTIIGIAMGVLALRLYPLVIEGLSWIGSRARGVVAFVGFRRVMRQSRLPVLVILLCISASTYAWVMRSSIEHGQEVSSWQAVGADYSVEGYGVGVALPSSLDLARLEHVDQVAFGRFFPRASANVERSRSTTEVLAIDAPRYAALNAGTPGDPLLPEFMLTDPPIDVGTETTPIPAIVSPDWPSGIDLAVGDTFVLDLGNMSPIVEVRQVRDRFPDIPPGSRFVVFDLAAIRAFSPFPVAPTVAYVRANRDAEPALRADVAEESTSAIFTSRYATLDAVSEDPFVDWAGDTLAIVFWFAALFAAIAAIAAPAIASAARRRDFAYLRTLGADERQSTQMTVIEQLPPLLVGTAAGMATGLLVSKLLEPALKLDVFTGNLVPTALAVDWPALLAMTGGLFGALGIAVVIFVLVNRRTQLTAVLRIGDE